MRIFIHILTFLLLSTLFFQCGNTAKQEAEKAKLEAQRAKAETDSLRNAMELSRQKAEEEKANSSGLPTSSVKESGKLNPVDEGQLSPSWRKFRTELIEVLKKKDVDGLMGMVDKEIKGDFNKTTGVEAFKKKWKLDTKPKSSLLWQELRNVVELGGTFDNKDRTIFTAPYIFTNFPQGYGDAEYGAITGQGVRVRNEPSRGARQVGQLSYDVVRLLPDDNPKEEYIGKERHTWVKIQLPGNNEVAYVYGKYIRTQTDYRASFEKKGDTWKMFFFVDK